MTSFWLAPSDDTLHPTKSSAAWLLTPSNQQVVSLTPLDIEYLDTLDVSEDADEIFSFGQRRGLVCVRRGSDRVTIHFWLFLSEEQRLRDILAAVARAFPQIAGDLSKTIALSNTCGGCEANAVFKEAASRRVLL